MYVICFYPFFINMEKVKLLFKNFELAIELNSKNCNFTFCHSY